MLCWDQATNSLTVLPWLTVMPIYKASQDFFFFFFWYGLRFPPPILFFFNETFCLCTVNHVRLATCNQRNDSDTQTFVNLPQVPTEGQTAHSDPRMPPQSSCVHSFFISEHNTSSVTRSTLVATTDNFLSLCLNEQWPDSCFHPDRLKRLWSTFLVSPGGFRAVPVTNC